MRDDGMPDAIAATSVRRHRSEDVHRFCSEQFGQLLQEVEVDSKTPGKRRAFWAQHPLVMLEVLAKEYLEVKDLFL